MTNRVLCSVTEVSTTITLDNESGYLSVAPGDSVCPAINGTGDESTAPVVSGMSATQLAEVLKCFDAMLLSASQYKASGSG